MNTPLVSVIVPAYNHAPFVKETIKSIINQDYSNIELLILDDGSKDQTYQILNQLKPACETRFHNVFMSTQNNAGIIKTLSKLVEKCQGKYILDCASDDMLCPSCISEQVNIMERNSQIIQTLPDNYFIDAQGNRLERSYNQEDTYYPLGTNLKNYPTFASFWKAQMPPETFYPNSFHRYEQLLIKHNFLNGSLWRAQYIKQIFPLPNYKMAEDHYINLQLSKLGTIHFVDKPLFKYRIHATQTVKNLSLLRTYEKNLFLAELEQVSKPEQEQWKQILKKVWFTPSCTRKGFPGCYLERQNSFICSKRILGLLGLKFVLHTRYRYQIPTWWKD